MIPPPGRDAVDLSLEKPEVLEATKERFGPLWRRSGLKPLGIAGAALLFVVLLAFFTRWYEGGTGTSALAILSLIGLGVFIWQTVGGLRIMLSRPPLAGETPEATLEQYYESFAMQLTINTGKIGVVPWPDSYICLLEQAKSRFSDYRSFIQYWRDAAVDAVNQLAKHYAPRNLTKVETHLLTRKEGEAEGEFAKYKIVVQVDATEGIDNPGISKSKPIGTAYLVDNVLLARIGKRWYLTCPYWAGVIQDDLAAA